jgi:hypothetical protein
MGSSPFFPSFVGRLRGIVVLDVQLIYRFQGLPCIVGMGFHR